MNREVKAGQVDIGLTSLPILCGLLGAVLLLNLHRGAETPNAIPDSVLVDRIEDDVTNVVGRLNRVGQRIQDKSAERALAEAMEQLKARQARLESDVNALRGQIGDVERRNAEAARLQDEIAAVEREIAEARRQAEDLRKRLEESKAKPSSSLFPFSGYSGAFVLLECDDEGVRVYPEGRRVATEAPSGDMACLRSRIKDVGAVALIVRPAGFKKPFTVFHRLISELGRESSAAGASRRVEVCHWPIEENEPIAGYMPKGGAR
jgi:hypothetical protein